MYDNEFLPGNDMMQSIPSLRFGLVGCGDIGALRARAIGQVEGCKLVAASDIDVEKARKVARTAEASWQKLVARPDLDALIVSTPPALHAEICVEALRAGKHVLCEKPLARTPEECAKIIEAAEKANRFLATGFNYRFYPSIVKAKQLFDSGLIGELDHIRGYCGYSAEDHSHAWIHDREIVGGGALFDNGIHLIDLTHYFLGDVAEIKGFASGHVWNFPGCEDNGFVLLRSTAGKVATLQASWTEWCGYQMLLEIYGTRGCIRAWCFPMWTEVRWCKQRGDQMRTMNFVFPVTFLMEHVRSYRWVVGKSFVREIASFARAIHHQSGENVATGWDGLRSVEIAYATYQDSGARAAEVVHAAAGH